MIQISPRRLSKGGRSLCRFPVVAAVLGGLQLELPLRTVAPTVRLALRGFRRLVRSRGVMRRYLIARTGLGGERPLNASMVRPLGSLEWR